MFHRRLFGRTVGRRADAQRVTEADAYHTLGLAQSLEITVRRAEDPNALIAAAYAKAGLGAPNFDQSRGALLLALAENTSPQAIAGYTRVDARRGGALRFSESASYRGRRAA